MLDGGAGSDVLVGFNPNDDSIRLENKIFTGLGEKRTPSKPAQLAKDAFFIGTKAHDASDRIVYDSRKGKLYYDADGTGSKAPILIGQLDPRLKLTYKDFFVI